MNKLRTILRLAAGMLAVFLSPVVALALDSESATTALVDRYIQIERSLTMPLGVSLAQQHLLAASLAVSQSTGEDRGQMLSYLMNADIAVISLKMSDTTFYWNGSSWANQLRNTYTYAPNHMILQSIEELFLGSAWTNQIRQSWTYDGSDRNVTWLEELWSTDHWENAYNYTNAYNGSGIPTESISQAWISGAWVNSTRAVPTYAGNLLTALTIQTWVTFSSTWTNSYRFLYSYDGSSRLTETLYQFASGVSWTNSSRTTNTYDGSGNLSQVIYQTWKGSAYQNSTRNDYAYDGSQHKTLGVNYDWDTLSSSFSFTDSDTSKYAGGTLMEIVSYKPKQAPVTLTRTDFFYDGNSNVVESIRQRYVSSTWTNSNRTVYVYSIAAVGELGGDGNALPRGFTVSQNYPNPFNMSTVIEYSLDHAGPVRVAVANILGQTVATLVDAYQEEGPHSAVWTGSDANGQVVASGIYFYSVQAAGIQQVRKMVLLK